MPNNVPPSSPQRKPLQEIGDIKSPIKLPGKNRYTMEVNTTSGKLKIDMHSQPLSAGSVFQVHAATATTEAGEVFDVGIKIAKAQGTTTRDALYAKEKPGAKLLAKALQQTRAPNVMIGKTPTSCLMIVPYKPIDPMRFWRHLKFPQRPTLPLKFAHAEFVRKLALDVAQQLAQFHAEGISVNDIKPANLRGDLEHDKKQVRFYIIDLNTPTTEPNFIATNNQTIYYRPLADRSGLQIEQSDPALHHRPDLTVLGKNDIWALGVSLLELMVGTEQIYVFGEDLRQIKDDFRRAQRRFVAEGKADAPGSASSSTATQDRPTGSPLADDEDVFYPIFSAARELQPVFTNFIVEHMLAVDLRKRADAAQVAAFFADKNNLRAPKPMDTTELGRTNFEKWQTNSAAALYSQALQYAERLREREPEQLPPMPME